MDSDTTGRVIYFVLLLAAIAASLIGTFLRQPSKSLQQLLIWGAIFTALIAGYGLWPSLHAALFPRTPVASASQISLTVAADGHYYVDALVNDSYVTFLIDTGASDIVLTRDDARRIGLDPDMLQFSGMAETANGTVATAPVTIDHMILGPYEDSALHASVSDGDMQGSLLGMSYLGQFDLRFVGERLMISR